MNPKDMAAWLTEDPDVMREAYCDACGGWDKEQQGGGHKLGCPMGKPGTSIKKMAAPKKSGLWVVSGRFPIDDIGMIFSDIKGYEGVVISYNGTINIWVSVMFDSYSLADEFRQTSLSFNGPIDSTDMVPPEEYHEYVDRFNTGAVERSFIRKFDLS